VAISPDAEAGPDCGLHTGQVRRLAVDLGA
jgi:hypothetical protein